MPGIALATLPSVKRSWEDREKDSLLKKTHIKKSMMCRIVRDRKQLKPAD